MDNKISILLKKFAASYLSQKEQPFRYTDISRILTDELPPLLRSRLTLRDDKYKVQGSVGNGNWAEIPWLAILDSQITTSTTRGYYIVILIHPDMKAFYLVLATGWTQFKNEYGARDAREQIKAVSAHYASILKMPSDFTVGPIDLGDANELGKGYGRGSIFSKKYTLDSFSEETLISDIEVLLELYLQLKGVVGSNIFNLDFDTAAFSDEVKQYRKVVAEKSLSENTALSIAQLIEEANKAPVVIREILKSQIVRNRKFSTFAKERVSYVCEICGKEPFFQRNGKLYAEADHIDPIAGRQLGADSPDNLRCLCAQCHRVITYGSDEEIEKLFLRKIIMV